MEAMKETRPFNLEHAKAGAPFACVGGAAVEILKWDRKAVLPIIGVIDDMDQTVMGWDYEGRNGNESNTHLVMTPLGFIDGKPVWADDEIELKCFAPPNEWKRVKVKSEWAGTWTDDCARWPTPEKVYPVTGIDPVELVRLHGSTLNRPGPDGGRHAAVLAVANAALRHAIDSGQVITIEDHCHEQERVYLKGLDDAKTYRADRDLAIARAVRIACEQHASGAMPLLPVFNVDVDAIIAKVQP